MVPKASSSSSSSLLLLLLLSASGVLGDRGVVIPKKPIGAMTGYVRDKVSLGWDFDAKERFYTPSLVNIVFRESVQEMVPVTAKLSLKKQEKFSYANSLQLTVGQPSTGRVVLDGFGISSVDYRLPFKFATIEPKVNFPSLEPEVAVSTALSPGARVRATLAPQKRVKLLFSFDVAPKTGLAIEPLLGDGTQTKVTLERAINNGGAMVSASFFERTATLAATIFGLKPFIKLNLDDPVAARPKVGLSYSFST